MLLLLAAGCGKETEKELANVKQTLAGVRDEFAEYKSTAAGEIKDLKAQLERTTQELADTERTRVTEADKLAAETEAKLTTLQQQLDAKAAEVTAAVQRADSLAKARDTLQQELEAVKSTMKSQTDKIESLKAELQTLKKLLGR